MYTHILIPIDGSRLSESASRHAIGLAKQLGAKATALIATPTFRFVTLDPIMSRDSPAQYERDSKRVAARALDKVKALARAAGVPCTTEHVVGDQAYKAIIGVARRKRCDLIVMGSHGRSGLGSVLLGSQTSKVLALSTIPVLVYRAGHRA